MSFFKNLLGLFSKSPKVEPVSVPPKVAIDPARPPAVPQTQLQIDVDIYRTTKPTLGLVDAENLKDEMNAKYAKEALGDLMKTLAAQDGQSTLKDALAQLEGGCKFVNNKYPLDWAVENPIKKPFGSTIRYRLKSHNVWINDTGAYCIVELKLNHTGTNTIIFEKKNASGTTFQVPNGYVTGAE